MEPWYQRTALLVGEEGVRRLRQSHVMVAGLGGVGSYAAEALARAGVGRMTIADSDRISATNRNRQLLALTSTENCMKAELMAGRIRDINPEIQLDVCTEYLFDRHITGLLEKHPGYLIDAIDTMTPKVFLIREALRHGIPLISSLGAGAKFDPLQVRIAGFSETYNCPFARMLRKRLHSLGVYDGFRVVFSPERVTGEVIIPESKERNKKAMVGTISYMPALFGLTAASWVIREILGQSANP
ncbi:MAG: tRNA threonylcarbamoyladenosine dehydratase [Bacteroidales bacterium]|nr:tRNA threonylcarbamoyladenosine dehydratase [Bacteroidales bacterium]